MSTEQTSEASQRSYGQPPQSYRQLPQVYGRVVVKPRTPRKSRAEVVLLENDAVKAELERRLKRAAKYIKPRERPVHALSRKCSEAYVRSPWIPEYDYTLLAFPKKMYPKYIDATIPAQEWDGLELFRPSAAYYALQCGPNSVNRIQKKDVLTLFDDTNSKVKLTLVHVLRTGEKVVQDERMFLDELSWLLAQNRRGRKAALLATTIGTDAHIDKTARSVVDSALASALPVSELQYASEIADAIYSSCKDWYTIRDMFFVASDILVFVDKVHFGRYAHRFVKKMTRKMYNPESLPGLSYTEKFPEAFANIHISAANTTYIYDLIVQSRSEITEALGARLTQLIDPTIRVRGADAVRPPVVNIPALESSCNVPGFSEDWELVTYTYSGKTYCYPISALLDKFISRDYSNPDTGIDFDQTFVTHIVNTYQPVAVAIPLVEDSLVEDSVNDKVNIIKALMSALEELESRLSSIDPSKIAKVCAYCDKYINRGGVSTLDKSGGVVKFCSMTCLSS
jgi:hypothetical protein